MSRKILILCIDRDADLKQKTGIAGPVVGRARNLDAANRLLLADPEEVDGNTIFEAVKFSDSMRAAGEDVEVATLTGDAVRGYAADREVADQLDRVLSQYPADSCIFVSDGADDEQIMPIISSRMKIDSVRVVSMRQSKELERTYFLILNKLQEPYFARIFIGVPAIILLGLVVSYWLGFEWKPVAALLGLYLLAKGFGFEDRIFGVITHFKFSAEQVSTIFYLIAMPLLFLAFWISIEEYSSMAVQYDSLKSIGYALKTLMTFLVPPFVIIYLGKLYDNMRVSNSLETLRMVFYSVITAVSMYIIWMFASWVIAEAFFGEFVGSLIFGIIIGALSMEVARYLKRDLVKGTDLLGKEVYSSTGNYLGKVVSVNDEDRSFVYLNPWKKRQSCDYTMVKGIDNRVNLV